jgi:methylated-DNA-protein-cysteine methyltransferase-like protein
MQDFKPRTFGEKDSIQAIWDVVARIPRGQVSTYGDVARAAGLPGRARLAGKALRLMPDDMNLPWHRVMGAGGRIVFPPRSRHFRDQARLLRSEGVPVKDGRVAKTVLTNLDEF